MRILITGGAGFIGTNLCGALLNMGNEVVCMDDLSTGRAENIDQFLTDTRFTFIKHDIVEPIPDIGHVDRIYNMACAASPPKYQAAPIQTLDTNYIGVKNLLDLARSCSARILQSSTSEVYGEPLESPQTESYRGNVNTWGPRACYDEGKRIAETLLFEYSSMYDVDVRVARIFNTYGPWMAADDGRVVSNFINQALSDQDITLYGTGEQTRSFCYIDDQVKGLIRLMEYGTRDPTNIGNPNEVTVKELATKIVKLTRSKSQIIFQELPRDDPTNRKPDISRAEQTIGWSPIIGLDEGLNRTIEYFNKNN